MINKRVALALTASLMSCSAAFVSGVWAGKALDEWEAYKAMKYYRSAREDGCGCLDALEEDGEEPVPSRENGLHAETSTRVLRDQGIPAQATKEDAPE